MFSINSSPTDEEQYYINLNNQLRFSKDGILNITGHIAAKTFFAGNETEYIQYNEDGFELKTHHLYQTVDKGPWSFVENASNTWSYALGNLDTHVDTQLPG